MILHLIISLFSKPFQMWENFLVYFFQNPSCSRSVAIVHMRKGESIQEWERRWMQFVNICCKRKKSQSSGIITIETCFIKSSVIKFLSCKTVPSFTNAANWCHVVVIDKGKNLMVRNINIWILWKWVQEEESLYKALGAFSTFWVLVEKKVFQNFL